jgi:hypothetical protein
MRRRRKDAEHDSPVDAAESVLPGEGDDPAPTGRGPWDVEDRPVAEDDPARADLGALSVPGHPDVELRLQVEEGTGSVAAVVMVTEEGALEVRPFAASRNHDMWAEVMPQIRDDIARQGGQAEEVDGPYGPALRTVIAGQTPEGEAVRQPAMLLGVNGPRWLLRVTAFGRPAVEWRDDGLLERQLADVVVVRGSSPMAPGDMLPVALPADARRGEA